MSLEDLRPLLMQIPDSEVRVPNLPVATALQEAHDLMRFTAAPAVHAALLSVGMPLDFTEQLEQRITAAREAQSGWVSERDRNKARELVDAETAAAETRSHMLAAGRFNLSGDVEAQARLTAIAGGEGVADLVQDLHDLAEVVERNLAAFSGDQTFDAEQQARDARELAQLLSTHVSDERLTPPNAARDLRDRAFSYLYDLVTRVREAGRYVFRNDDEMRQRFSSRYRRRMNRRRYVKLAQAKAEVVRAEVVEEEMVED